MEDKSIFTGIISSAKPSSIPFWSLNNELDKGELLREINRMYAAGYGGFVFHARTGLKTEYLGEKWFDCVSACLKKAKKLGMEMWIYDENGWPSGFVGGKLLEREDFRARFLEFKICGAFDSSAYCVYIMQSGEYKLVEEEVGADKYYCIYLRISPANTDILNPEVVKAFIAETHEKYYERFKESFGKELVGFFTDEPQYYRWATPFTPSLTEYFADLGVDIKENLIWLFVHDRRGYAFRTEYYGRLNFLYNTVYYKTLMEWCSAHNCLLTGHSVEEPFLFTQMYGGAGVMGTYEYEHIPGIDCLGRNCGSEIAPKQLGSVASQLGIKNTLTETYGCSGYDVTLYELKSLGDFQFFNGVNKMCQHLYPMSIAGQGKYDHPPVFSSHVGLDEEFKQLNTYFDRLGYIVSHTEEIYDVAVIHPMRSVYLEYIREEDYASVKALEDSFAELITRMRKNGVMFQFIDETLFEKYGTLTKEGYLKMGGNVYTSVIVPKMQSISSAVLTALKGFKGKLFLGNIPSYVDGKPDNVTLRPTATFDDIVKNTKFRFACEDGNSFMTVRRGDIGEFAFIKNLSRTQKSEVFFTEAKNYAKIDLLTGELSPFGERETLAAGEGVILTEIGAERVEASSRGKCINVTQNFRVTHISENWLTMDYAELSYDGKNFGGRKPIQQIFEELLRKDYKGDIYVRQKFTVRDVCSLTMLAERQNYKYYRLNGRDINFKKSDFDIYFEEAKLENVAVGGNVLEYKMNFWQHDGVHFALFDPMATESLRNCLCFDTSVENTYIKGDFALDKDFCIVKRAEIPITSDMCGNGYPFFFGTETLCGEIEYSGDEKVLDLSHGRYTACKLWVNGKRLPFSFDGKFNLRGYVNKGKNEVKIELKSSMRNMMGPHHFKNDREPLAVSPIYFTMRGGWGEGISSGYTHEYSFVPFGMDKILLED